MDVTIMEEDPGFVPIRVILRITSETELLGILSGNVYVRREMGDTVVDTLRCKYPQEDKETP